jgi:hypothetical protein
MKKSKLIVEYEIDFDAYGVASSAKGYKLAWEINKRLGINLIKQDDLIVGLKKNIEKSFTYFSFETSLNRLKLLRNRPVEELSGKYFLVPEFPHFDFIILARLNELNINEPLEDLLRQIPAVELVSRIDMDNLKSKSNFVF